MSVLFNIAPATEKDVPALVKLVNSAYRGEGSKQGWTTEADLLDGLRADDTLLSEMINQPGAVILKCESGESGIIGCVNLQQQSGKLYLGMLTVSPAMQAHGIGKQMLAAAEEYAHQHHCKGIVMTVISVRGELIAWYERHGYVKTGETKPFPAEERFGIPKQHLEFIVLEKIIQKQTHAA